MASPSFFLAAFLLWRDLHWHSSSVLPGYLRHWLFQPLGSLRLLQQCCLQCVATIQLINMFLIYKYMYASLPDVKGCKKQELRPFSVLQPTMWGSILSNPARSRPPTSLCQSSTAPAAWLASSDMTLLRLECLQSHLITAVISHYTYSKLHIPNN